MKIKTPNNYKLTLSNSISFDSNDSSNSGKTIFRLHDRLFNSKIISILSKKNSKLSRNILSVKPRQTPANLNLNLERIKNFSFKSFEKNFSPVKKLSNELYSNIYKKIYESADENKPRISFIFHRDHELKRRDSLIFLPKEPTLSSDRGPKNRKKYMLVNQIIKFYNNRQKEQKKELSPMKLRKSYFEFIEKKNKIKYNPNFNSPYIHRINSNYLINNIFDKFKQNISPSIIRLKKQKQKEEKEQQELEIEKRDKIEEMSVDLQNYKKAIKIFLTDETKLNQINFHEEFFDSFVNKINYLFDDRKYPTIKNNLKKIYLEFNEAGNEWKRLNMIEISTLTYLHKLKAKIQRELDEIREENKDKNIKITHQIGKYIYKNKKKRKKIYSSKNINNISKSPSKSINKSVNKSINKSVNKSINRSSNKTINKSISLNKSTDNEKNEEEANKKESIIDNNNEEKNGEEEEEEKEEELVTNKEDLYDLEEFFVHKGRENKRIPIASPKDAYVVYNNPRFYKNNFEIKKKKKKAKNKKSEFDVYI